MSTQGYVKKSNLIKWLYEDIAVHVTGADIAVIVRRDCKARYNIVNGEICAVNGHSLSLPLMTFETYDHRIGGHPRYLVHETYMKCLRAILKEGLSRMSRNHVHLSMQIGKAGLQRKKKPTVAIYVDIVRASADGLVFQHFANDVIMCPGDKSGISSPHFFNSVRDINTGALIDFENPATRLREAMEGPDNVSEVVLPPPWGGNRF